MTAFSTCGAPGPIPRSAGSASRVLRWLRPAIAAPAAMLAAAALLSPGRTEGTDRVGELTVSSELSTLRPASSATTLSPGLGSPTPAPAFGPTFGRGAASGVIPTGNLIVNGDAEAGSPSPDGIALVPIPGWTTGSGGPTVILYTLNPVFGAAGPGDPGPPNRGTPGNLNYFTGGNATASSALTQVIDLSTYAAATDSGGITYTLSGYLGGWLSQDDNARLTIDFRNAAHTIVGTQGSLGPVLATDRGNLTGLLLRSASGTVPLGAREALVTLSLTRTAGSYNDGYADNLSLTLVPEPATGVLSVALGLAAIAGWRHARRGR